MLLSGAGAAQKLPWVTVAKLLGLWCLFSSLQLAKHSFTRCSLPHTCLVWGQAAAMLCSGSLLAWQVSPGFTG